jgi:hypothetical protein
MYPDIQPPCSGIINSYTYSVSEAGGRIRTPDRLITNQLLYQLSYASAT